MRYACPVKDCQIYKTSPIAPFCPTHWAALPKDLQTKIKEARNISLAAEVQAIKAAQRILEAG